MSPKDVISNLKNKLGPLLRLPEKELHKIIEKQGELVKAYRQVLEYLPVINSEWSLVYQLL